ncbi:hypothetical protein [Enterococcus pallens]|uniref:TPR repeat-containing protein n=1 Tax=Enterococcus pallens ATCC BAA-351 TaxID=1158607 RepID=R2SB28_9ENTE|nr:hypothetical protein [Enterococcus pallens]EOH90036.1 hypothetical protein UAU_03865 [Enterococcus pallens ATCC BAA-351]EOU15358.1 hypothetical protein I588_04290 [Enterococcus pallens ATCC BAA-351]
MSNIEFPKNYEYYLKKGQEALEGHRLAEGVVQLEKAYQLEQDPVVNWLIATTTFEIADYSKSLSYIEELPDFYVEEESRAELYLQNLLMEKDFLNARKLLWEIKKQGKLNKYKIQNLTNLLEMQEKFYRQTQQSLIQEIKQELVELSKYSAAYQLQKVQKIKDLPQADLLDVSKKLLIDPRISLLVRNFLFEELVKVGTQERVSILTIDGKINHLYPNEIGASDTMVLTSNIMDKLEITLENQDPILLENLREEVKVEMAILYPLHQLYEDSKFWVNSYLSEYLHKDYPLDQEIELVRGKIKRELNRFYE